MIFLLLQAFRFLFLFLGLFLLLLDLLLFFLLANHLLLSFLGSVSLKPFHGQQAAVVGNATKDVKRIDGEHQAEVDNQRPTDDVLCSWAWQGVCEHEQVVRDRRYHGFVEELHPHQVSRVQWLCVPNIDDDQHIHDVQNLELN